MAGAPHIGVVRAPAWVTYLIRVEKASTNLYFSCIGDQRKPAAMVGV